MKLTQGTLRVRQVGEGRHFLHGTAAGLGVVQLLLLDPDGELILHEELLQRQHRRT